MCAACTDVQYKEAGCVELPSLTTLLARLLLVVAYDEVINLCRTICLSCSWLLYRLIRHNDDARSRAATQCANWLQRVLLINNLTTRHIMRQWARDSSPLQPMCNIFIDDAIHGQALIDLFMFPPAISRRKHSVFGGSVGRSVDPSVCPWRVRAWSICYHGILQTACGNFTKFPI